MNSKTNAPKILEVMRIILSIIGFWVAYSKPGNQGLIWLLGLVIIPLTGLTGIESLLFSKSAALIKGRTVGSAYQIQSAFNNLATAITAIIVLVFKFDIQAQITICLVALIFFTFSSLNHAREYFFEEKPAINLQRVIVTLLLLAGSLPLLIKAL